MCIHYFEGACASFLRIFSLGKVQELKFFIIENLPIPSTTPFNNLPRSELLEKVYIYTFDSHDHHSWSQPSPKYRPLVVNGGTYA